MSSSRELGLIGEDSAAAYLLKKDYKILKRNFRFGYHEVDIIAMKDRILHGIEVKAWAFADVDELEYSVNWNKLRRVANALLGYACNNELRYDALQVDSLFINTVSREIYFFEDVYQEDANAGNFQRNRTRTPF